ncbi:MAG TPA: acetylxylan esterase [Chthoniobacteraceae bacterium]|nr:acetylxylan esterase [Chthoniobacteraceae bacterium]
MTTDPSLPTGDPLPPMIHDLWQDSHGFLHGERLRMEAMAASRGHRLPLSLEGWRKQADTLAQTLNARLHLAEAPCPLDVQIHGEICLDGYRIRKVSFASSPGIRVTALLYIPEGKGPFPGVLNLHGHWFEGKIAARVQSRGHLLAKSGFVVLSPDAPGSGERGSDERQWSYHGGAPAAELFLAGDSLLGWQVRDNRRAIDLLQSLPFVDPDRIGATGASGGGNQTIWLSALDDRIKAAVPVVSVGSFEAYITRRNCLCETLPGGLALGEQWMVLGSIAPRPLLILNALLDAPAFAPEPLRYTARQVGEIYRLLGAQGRFDVRLLNMEHGFFPPALAAMIGWMRHWLCDDPSPAPVALPSWMPLPEEALICYPPGERPETVDYRFNREAIRLRRTTPVPGAGGREALAPLLGWREPSAADSKAEWKTLHADGSLSGCVPSVRGVPIPLFLHKTVRDAPCEVRLLLSAQGKKSPFVLDQWRNAIDAGAVPAAADLPATGELCRDHHPMEGCEFHDDARAALWLGYPLAGEWAEAIVSLCLALRHEAPGASIRIVAHQEAAFAALLARALRPLEGVSIEEHDGLHSLLENRSTSLAWHVPGFLRWGDLDRLRSLAES